jgi:Peptidase C13 family
MQEPIDESTRTENNAEHLQTEVAPLSADPSQSFSAYFVEAFRATFFLAPIDARLPKATPSFVLLVCLLAVAVEFAAGYAMVAPNARFYPEAVNAGWLGVVVLLLACWMTLYRRDATSDATLNHVGSLFALATLLGAFVYAITSLVYVPFYRSDVLPDEGVGLLWQWILWGSSLVWSLAAIIVLLARKATHAKFFVATVALLLTSSAIHFWAQPAVFWYPDYEAREENSSDKKTKRDWSHLRPERLLKQAGILDAALAALPAQTPGKVDIYVITYSPYASEDVFLKEGVLVADVMSERFGTRARTIRLVNHASTVDSLPWATPENLKKTIDHIGKLIDPTEDIAFIHLASHGGSDGKLSAEFWPLQIDTLTGAQLRTMLDDANIALRLLSISACYSGGWIAPLSTEGTLVMTASDADHTSYGCGRKSELTFFTRAVFDEQLRTTTRSFEEAFKAAKPIIEAREKEAGKKDGFSNPQIFIGEVARKRIERWLGEIEVVQSSKGNS